MTPEDIIRMAREARLVSSAYDSGFMERFTIKLEHFAALVADAEREACAKIATETVCDMHIPTGVKIYGTRAAAAIRARGEG